VIPEFRGHLEPLRARYDRVVAKKRDYGAPAMAAIKKAYEDAGQQMPEDLNPTNLR
jgi:limonene 1,2-monooxygenase